MGSWLLCRRPRRTPEPAGILAASRRHIPVLFVLPIRRSSPGAYRPHGRIGDPWRLGDIRPLANPFSEGPVAYDPVGLVHADPQECGQPLLLGSIRVEQRRFHRAPRGASLPCRLHRALRCGKSRSGGVHCPRRSGESGLPPAAPPSISPSPARRKIAAPQGAMSIRAFPLRDTLKDSGVFGPNPPKRSSSLSTTRCQCPGESLTHTTRHSGLKLRRPSAAVPSALLRSSVSTRSSSRRASRRRLPPTPKIGCRRRSSRSRWW